VIGDHPEQPVLSADLAVIEFDPSTVWSETVRVQTATATRVGVHLAWDASGRSNLARLWTAPEPDEPARTPRPWSFDAVHLSEGVVSLKWPTWSLHFDAVECAGAIRRGAPEGLVIKADLTGAEASLDVGGQTQRFDAHVIEGFEWQARHLRAERVALTSLVGAEISIAGEMGFVDGTSADLRGHATVAPARDDDILGQWLPEGGAVRALAVARASGAPWRFNVTEAAIPRLLVGSWEVSGLAASFEAQVGRGGLVPSIGLQSEGARARSLAQGESVRLDEVVVGSVNLNVGVATDAKVSDVTVSELQLDGTKVESLTFEGGVVANIGGGAVDASLTTATGSVMVSGPIETSLLSRRVDAELSWRFDRVHGGLGTWLRGTLPEVQARAAPEVLDGSAMARLGVPASGSVTWSWVRFDWTEGLP
jgi:hypothetical protein